MHFTKTVASTFALSAIALAHSITLSPADYNAQLAALLKANGFNTLLAAANPGSGPLIPMLMTAGSRWTILAPTDAAFAALPAGALNDPATAAAVIQYHILQGAQVSDGSPLTAGHSIIPTTLTAAANLVNLGGAPQVVVGTEGPNNAVTVVQPSGSVTSSPYAEFQNLVLYGFPSVLLVPSSMVATLGAAGLTGAAQTIAAAPNSQSVINNNPSVTFFAPNNAALMAVASGLKAGTLETIVSNHVVSGQALYSNALPNGATFKTAAGQDLTIINNSSGIFVSEMGGVVVAKVVQSDLIASNGVIHVLDGVLNNANGTPAPASTNPAPPSGPGPVAPPSGAGAGVGDAGAGAGAGGTPAAGGAGAGAAGAGAAGAGAAGAGAAGSGAGGGASGAGAGASGAAAGATGAAGSGASGAAAGASGAAGATSTSKGTVPGAAATQSSGGRKTIVDALAVVVAAAVGFGMMA